MAYNSDYFFLHIFMKNVGVKSNSGSSYIGVNTVRGVNALMALGCKYSDDCVNYTKHCYLLPVLSPSKVFKVSYSFFFSVSVESHCKIQKMQKIKFSSTR